MTTAAQRSVLSTLDDIAQAHQQLGLPPEPDDMAEAWFIIEQIEAKLAKQKAEA